MDPATLTLVAMLSAGAFACLATLYVTLPYPAPMDPDVSLGQSPLTVETVDTEGQLADEHLPLAA